jgi:xylulokinase
VEPNHEARPLYDELYDLYTSLYPATRDHAHALARIQEIGS